MLLAIIAVAALLLPWFAAHLAVGIVAGPILLRSLVRHGVAVDPLRDAPVSILAWPVLLAHLVLRAA